jgi:hypothetical protein
MSELVLLPLGPELLAFTCEELETARKRARTLLPPAAPNAAVTAPEALLDADAMQSVTGVPATWWLEAARRDEVPALRFGKYVRFRLSDVLAASPDRLRGHHTRRTGAGAR